MSELVDPAIIEKIVGARRQDYTHVARAVSAEENVYVMHSKKCLRDTGDLRECEYSLASDLGIDPEAWPMDVAVIVDIDAGSGRLIPAPVQTSLALRGRGLRGYF